ncbi:MAG: hypothetical protein L3K17_05030 [Thermoplasmata archaeon]|nr:hypothetical protein [Thermoplasmata archaeon]
MHPLTLDTPPFFVILALLGLFIAMLWLLRQSHPRARRALDGYLEASAVDIVFLAFAVILVIGLVAHDPRGNATSFALYEVILRGYWLAFAIPIVTVGSSVHSRSKGTIPWLWPSVLVAVALFLVFFGVYLAAS